jgi:hypothetical protein
MKIGLFTEFSYTGNSEQQAYAEVLEHDFFSITESFGKDFFCSPFPLGLYAAAAQVPPKTSDSDQKRNRSPQQ